MSMENLLRLSRTMAAWKPPESFVALANSIERQNARAAIARAAVAIAGQGIIRSPKLGLGLPKDQPKAGD